MQLYALPDALSVLSAMITPAVLISACASLIMATSGRLNRAVDRTRDVSARFGELALAEASLPGLEERRVFFTLLDLSTTRSRLLQRAMARLYWALGMFVGTSVAIGTVSVLGRAWAWIPIGIGIGGAGLLLYASLLLVRESRMALQALEIEMDFLWARGRSAAGAELLATLRARRSLFRWRGGED
jgi:hypothetical protein